MKRRILTFITLLSLSVTPIFGQQEKLLTHFIYDKMSINPGATGMGEGICATMIYRNQWDKFNGAPNSTLFNAEANLNRFFPGGVGLSFYNDAIGFSRQNNLTLNYSFPISLPGNAGVLGIGVGAGIVNYGMTPNWVTPDPTAVDPILPGPVSATNLDLNLGLYWKGPNDIYAGLSTTHLSASKLKLTEMMNFNTARHYYLMGGKKFRDLFGNDQDLDAQVLVRTDMIKYSADINVRYIYQNTLYGGLTYRTSDAIGVMVGYTLRNNLTFGYSYDFTVSKLSSISRGSHELVARYCYFLPPPPLQKSKHPRWL